METRERLSDLRRSLRVHPRQRLMFALDVATLEEARPLVTQLASEVGVFKVGLELFTAAGPAALTAVHDSGRQSFLDLKLHDIPATVERAVAAAVRLGATYLTVHAAAGPSALRAAAQAARDSQLQLLAVTLLTSTDEAQLAAIGMQGPLPMALSRLARIAVDCGIPGLICAPSDCAALRAELGNDVLLVTPGVRPTGADVGDQKRVGTPAAAIAAGADCLVVGRPIRDASDRCAAARDIVQDIARAL